MYIEGKIFICNYNKLEKSNFFYIQIIQQLSRQWLGEQQCHRTLTLGNTSLSIWMRFVPSEVTLRRVPTAKPGALFGAKIQQVCK